jgi:DNA polymerase/3'-5' exonuclease PolX
MNNAAIAQVFQDMADLLELKEDNPFKMAIIYLTQ